MKYWFKQRMYKMQNATRARDQNTSFEWLVDTQDVNCHGVPFHKVWWESMKGLRRYGPTCSLQGVFRSLMSSDDVIGCVLSWCSLPQSLMRIDPGVKEIWAYMQFAGCFLQSPMTSSRFRWRHRVCLVMLLPSTKFDENRSWGYGDMGLYLCTYMYTIPIKAIKWHNLNSKLPTSIRVPFRSFRFVSFHFVSFRFVSFRVL